MTYKELQDAVLGRRFPAPSQRENAKRWLRSAYADVWAAYDWTFKRVSLADVAVASGGIVTMPVDFGREIAVYSDQGTRLTQMSQDRFEEEFVVQEIGTAVVFMSVDGQITVAPAPSPTTYQLSYQRRIAHRNSGGSVLSGFMSDDTDTPLWGEEHHAILVPRATVIGLLELNDPTWEPQQEEYERQLSRMRLDLETTRPQLQWGAQSWDA